MPLPKEQAWFPTKRFGYGWGWPRRWQGQVVLLLYFAAFVAGMFFIAAGIVYYVLYMVGLTTLLVAICWWKGERPRWRWGADE